MSDTTRVCTKCGVGKNVSEFHIHKGRTDGLRAHCKQCRSADYAEGRDAFNAQKRSHYAANKEEIRARRRQDYCANRETIRAQQRAYYYAVGAPRKTDRRRFLATMKEGAGCKSCGTTDGRLDFHHRAGETKLFNVAHSVWRAWPDIMTEVWKCDVLCASCHARLPIGKAAR